MSRLWPLWLFMGISGCGASEMSASLRPQTGRVELGPQGGAHLLLDFECEGCSDEVMLRYGIEDAYGNELTFSRQRHLRLDLRDGRGVFSPLVAIFLSSSPPEAPEAWVHGEVQLDSGDHLPIGEKFVPYWPPKID